MFLDIRTSEDTSLEFKEGLRGRGAGLDVDLTIKVSVYAGWGLTFWGERRNVQGLPLFPLSFCRIL